MAGRGGARPGAGRPQGPSKATIEQTLIAERAVATAKLTGRPLGKERLEQLTEIFVSATAFFQPTIVPGAEPNPNQNWDEFYKWGRLAMECAAKLTPYQSPVFRAIVVSTPGEGHAPATLEPVMPTLKLDASDLSAAERAQQTYLRLVRGE